ncbi:hypothetical protein [Paraburkholderia sp. C35]|uniref:hypothetical protein n=1 Tax=Paraburkholderia sp. C35 TaxID=2126993 RepID=UPI000D68D40A|nr:hypothetical protein [Paraburkholderia sp. C35]
MKRDKQTRLLARLTVFAVALMVTEGLAFILSSVLHIFSFDASPVEFGIFGAVTTVLASEWLLIDAQRAFAVAEKGGFLTRDESQNRIRSVKKNCPKLWLVTLHLRLHPELTGP